MNFHINQDIVCIRSHSRGAVKEGETYTILGLKQTPCVCETLLIDVGIGSQFQLPKIVCCPVCGYQEISNNPIHWFDCRLFKPLDELTNIDELKEVLEKPIFTL